MTDEHRILMLDRLAEQVPEFATRVTPIFRLTNYKWMIKGKWEVPSQPEIVERANEMLRMMKESKSGMATSGGLQIMVDEFAAKIDFTFGAVVYNVDPPKPGRAN